MGVSKELKWIRYYPKSRWKGGCSLQLGGFGCLCFHQEVKKQKGGKRGVAHGLVAANFITHVSQMDIKCLTAGFFLKWGWPLIVETLNEEDYPSEFRLAEIHKDKQHALSSSLIPPRVKHHSYHDLNPTPNGYQPSALPDPIPFLSSSSPDRAGFPHSPCFGAAPGNSITAMNLSASICVNDDGRLPGLGALPRL